MSFRNVYGNDWSENGWRMVNADDTIVVTVAGMGLRVRRGYPALALGAWVQWYHDNVEPIDRYKPLDDWGWSAQNDVGTSNHLSGTAVDLNATQYPWGARTMPAARKAKIREGLALFEGVIFWGADWSRADEMHYQLNAGTSSGTGSSQKLIDFCNRRIVNGKLNTGDTMSAKEVNDFTAAFNGPIGSDVKDIREQLTGGRNKGQYPGWSQLGNRTIVDAIAAIGAHLGIEGFTDTKAGK